MVSVIVPSFNYAHLLPGTLCSLREQTFADWECIVVDNGSTDNTEAVVKSFSEKDNRIHYIYQPASGPAAARNHGIKLAKGEYIQFLDADDLLEKKKLEVQVRILQNQSAYDIVYSNMNYFSSGNPGMLFNNIHLNKENDHPWMKKLSGYGDTMIKALLRENIMVINSPLIRKAIFQRTGSFDESLKYNEDWELWVRCALNNVSFLFDDAPYTRALVRVHTTSYSSDRFKMYVYGLKACMKMTDSIKQWKYKKIILPKIFYHQDVIDKKVLDAYPGDKIKSLEMVDLVFAETEIPRYQKYKWLINKFPYRVFYIYSKILFLLNVAKRILIYVS